MGVLPVPFLADAAATNVVDTCWRENVMSIRQFAPYSAKRAAVGGEPCKVGRSHLQYRAVLQPAHSCIITPSLAAELPQPWQSLPLFLTFSLPAILPPTRPGPQPQPRTSVGTCCKPPSFPALINDWSAQDGLTAGTTK